MSSLTLFTEDGSIHEKCRPTIFNILSSNYKIECYKCGKTYKANIPELKKGKVSCPDPECGYTLKYKFF
jgi:hypothetical protein